jgi:hypothetical protein
LLLFAEPFFLAFPQINNRNERYSLEVLRGLRSEYQELLLLELIQFLIFGTALFHIMLIDIFQQEKQVAKRREQLPK